MSYSKFLDDLNTFYKDPSNKAVHPDRAMERVRDKWIEKGKLNELILFILENWDSGNCDEFIKPFEDYLLNNNCSDLYKKLWKGIIKVRLNELRNKKEEKFRQFTLEGVAKFKTGLSRLNDSVELENLLTFEQELRDRKKVVYPS